MKREDIQKESIIQYVGNNRVGTIVLPTGLGKSYIGCTIVGKQLKSGKVSTAMVVVPTTNLIEQWKQEFIKWGYNPDDIEFHCLKTAYKLDKKVDILVIDEIHTALSPEYRAIFENIQYDQLLGLTATVPRHEEYQTILSKYCPIVYHKQLSDIAEENILADFQVYNLKVKLTRKDRAKYKIFDANFKFAQSALGKLKFKLGLADKTIFDIANEYQAKKDAETDVEKEAVRYAKSFWNGMTMRKYVCYNSENKLAEVHKIVNKITNRRWILFNKTIKQAEKLKEVLGPQAVVYHSKMKDDERENVLRTFEEDKTLKYLIAADALNAGLNIPDLDGAISLSGVSTELDNVQRLGRILRFSKDKKAIFINLYSEDTIEKNWVEARNKNIQSIWVDTLSQIIEYERRR